MIKRLIASSLWALAPSVAGASELPAFRPSGGPVWVCFDRRDLSKPVAKGFPLSSLVAADDRGVVYRTSAAMLPLLSDFMHDRFGRCGGFFAYRTKEEAIAAMSASRASSGGSYTLDQQSVVVPLMPLIKEANLRATIESLAAFNNRFYTSETGVEGARWVRDRWGAIAAKIPGASVALVAHDGWSQPSVVLTIPGSDASGETVVLGGHLDSINGWGEDDAARAPGADDNASGIAVLTEAARVLAESGWRPKRTVQFMGYAAEEVGLRGSQDIAGRYAAEGRKVVGVIQYDMSNYQDSNSADQMFLLTDHVDESLSAFVGRLIDVYVGARRSTTECGYACSDHASWTRQGYPAAMAFEASFDGMNHNLHTDHDTLANSGGDAKHSVPFAKLAVAFAVELGKTMGAQPR